MTFSVCHHISSVRDDCMTLDTKHEDCQGDSRCKELLSSSAGVNLSVGSFRGGS